MHRHPLRSGDAPQTQQPLKFPLPSTQKTPVANQPDRLRTTTNLPEKPPTHARPLHIYAIKTFSPHPCFLPSAHIPPTETHAPMFIHAQRPSHPSHQACTSSWIPAMPSKSAARYTSKHKTQACPTHTIAQTTHSSPIPALNSPR